MKKINWKILNSALWIEIVLSYFLPFHVIHDFQYQVGFPMAFLSVYDRQPGKSPFLSMHLNPLGFLLDVLIIYLVLAALGKVYLKFKCNQKM